MVSNWMLRRLRQSESLTPSNTVIYQSPDPKTQISVSIINDHENESNGSGGNHAKAARHWCAMNLHFIFRWPFILHHRPHRLPRYGQTGSLRQTLNLHK